MNKVTDRDRLIKLFEAIEKDPAITCPHYKTNKTCDTCKYTINNAMCNHLERKVDYLLANGVMAPPKEEKKMVYFPFPIECENCSKVTEIGVCEELGLLYAGKHPKYSKEQDWDFMCANCPHEVTEREYFESDEKHIGKTVFLTKEEAEEKLKELGK